LLNETIRNLLEERYRIPVERLGLLSGFARCIAERSNADQPTALLFLCTHNSRRSHMAQLWTRAAVDHFGLKGITAYSGGTEATSFHPSAVRALTEQGFRITKLEDSANSVHGVAVSEGGAVERSFSKIHDHPVNPTHDFIAVMTCSSADQACPVVAGSAARFALLYDDPKVFDGTAAEAAAYQERSRQIGREMLSVFQDVAEATS